MDRHPRPWVDANWNTKPILTDRNELVFTILLLEECDVSNFLYYKIKFRPGRHIVFRYPTILTLLQGSFLGGAVVFLPKDIFRSRSPDSDCSLYKAQLQTGREYNVL